MNEFKRIIFCLAMLLPASLPGQKKRYVSPDGDDANKGTRTSPYATIERALKETKGKSGAFVIYLSEGTYYLKQPVVIDAEDFGSKRKKLTITNLNNQKVSISGAIPLKLAWKEYRTGIWKAQIDQELVFDQLFVNGQLQRMARYPNFDSTARYLGGTSADALSRERVLTWKHPEGGIVHALHQAEWGDFHYVIKGANAAGELSLEGGWQNNRRMGMHDKYRYVENIFEELDTVGEWYFDKKTKTLFYYPPNDLDLNQAKIEVPQIAHLFEFRGNESNPVRNVSLKRIALTQTLRTFMENREPLLRSDWTIYRGGAVLFDGAVDCKLEACTLTNLGGNAVFFNNFNRNCTVTGCLISDIAASALCFVGDPASVRSPSFEYYQFVPLNQIDRTPGAQTNNYPANCLVYDNLIYNTGLVEKQSAGVQVSMSIGIRISHNSIYDVPRAGINVSEGTWGGHIIEYNDVFNTVKESGDHGSFNSWGRDRFWHPDRRILDSIVENNFELTMLDVVQPITIRNNRFRCDHGWDIDLDDGSSNYKIYNNLCLNGGIKLREGANRVVENNIMVNNTFHPHVWFRNSQDIFRHNIVSTGYLPINIPVWGKETDYNVFPDSASLKAAQSRGTDAHSVCGPLSFVNPLQGDFQLKQGSVAFSVGFKNFPMDSFGVISPELKSIAKKPTLPVLQTQVSAEEDEVYNFMGAKIKNLLTLGERSATGMDKVRGLLVISIEPVSRAAAFLQTNDVILSFNNRTINKMADLKEARLSVIGSHAEMIIFRNQKEQRIWIDF